MSKVSFKSLSSLGISVIDGDRGKHYPKQIEFMEDGHCLFLSAKNVTSEGLKFNEAQFIDEKKDNLLGKGKLKRGDIVITTRGTVGNIALFNDSIPFQHVRINSGMAIIRNETTNVGTGYLYNVLKSPVISRQIEMMTFGSAQPQLTIDIINKLRIPAFPLPEQSRIDAILSTWDRAIERTRELIEAKTKLKKALMQQLLTGKRRFKEFGKPWNKKRLHDICTLSYGKSQKKVISDEGKYPIWGTGGIVGYADDFLYNKPSIIIGRKGTIDKPSYCPTPFWAIDTTFYTEIKKGIDPQWLFQRFLVIPWRRFNEASGVPSLSRETIYKIKVEVPEEEEQKRIGLVLQAMDMEIDVLNQKVTALHAQKTGLMQNLLTGKVRVKV